MSFLEVTRGSIGFEAVLRRGGAMGCLCARSGLRQSIPRASNVSLQRRYPQLGAAMDGPSQHEGRFVFLDVGQEAGEALMAGHGD